MADEKAPAPVVPGSKIDTDLSTKVDDQAAEQDPRQGLPSTVKVETSGQAFAPDTTKRKDPKGQYIQYNGVGTVRIMGPEEWKSAGVDSEDYCEWNYLNHKRIPRASFSDEQLQYLLRIDDRFELVEITDDPEDKSGTDT